MVMTDEEEGPAPLPVDAAAYLTPAGAARFQAELHQLRAVERPKVVEVVSWAAGNGDRSENGDYIYGKKRLREIDRRMRFLIKRLEKAKIVDPSAQTVVDRVFFGATVTYADEDEHERTVTIVGVDEARLDQGEISLVSPVARALLRARVGDWVPLRKPGGDEEIEVRGISYPTSP
ncbi:MAG: transcription elongation factor GreB [Alphaproteobacteria bacterium]|nr:transcription elongation factor GreB [Alphaproteobacteria bacterium]